MTAPAAAPPRFEPGALVHARGRDWVVLPPDPEDPDLLLLRPLGGTDDDAAGLYLPLEGADVASATLPPPDPRHVGDAVSARLLRDAVRLGFRSAAGPLRSLGRIVVQPRPYQLVPLLMALKQEPVRLLIGDDVGIGKTIEAALIARELLDRGEIRRLCVLCSPQLCEQWQAELSSKFHIEAEVVRPGTVARLERRLEREGQLDLSRTLFEEYPFTVVSIDYIKSDRRRADFVRTCPELVIVDEAHTVAEPGGHTGAQHQRHALVAELAEDPRRHLILATATPHSGDQDAFASLVGLLQPDLAQAVAALEYGAGTEARERLARHFVQRRRADIKRYLDAETDFPDRKVAEQTYRLTPEYRSLLERVVNYARQLVRDAAGGSAFQQRISWWAALALLRCVSSSPAAAATSLRSRAPRPEAGQDVAAVNRLGAAAVLDLDQQDDAAGADSTPGADVSAEDEAPQDADRASLLRLAREAEALMGDADPKLAKAVQIVEELRRDGFRPIVFCRYIATAHYVGEALRKRLRGAPVEIITGELPPEDRDARVQALDAAGRPVLVATDCLSEGVNLQHIFNAVVHYDLAWNPTRHEQREGRVDRYGQTETEVRTVLLYGQDNRVDGVVLEVLLRKAELIRKTLGVAVPVPADTDKILEAIFDKLFDRPSTDYRQLELFVTEQQRQLDGLWRAAEEREQRTRMVFAQYALKPEEVRAELDQALAAVGSAEDVRWFVEDAFTRLGHRPAVKDGLLELDLSALPPVLCARLPDPLNSNSSAVKAGFQPAVPKGAIYLARTHPLIEALGSYLLDTALDEPEAAKAARAGAMRTAAVAERTTLLLLRGRYVIGETRQGETRELLGEEALLAAFTGPPAEARWLAAEEAERLARDARPVANVLPEQAQAWLDQALDALPSLRPALDDLGRQRAEELLAAHARVRSAAALRGVRQQVEAKLPLDVLGVYILMPPPVGA
jgi:superfamily II DNA or RNA helicase